MKKFLVVLFCVGVLSVGLSAAQTFEGTWDFYFDWGCNGSYAHVTITFKNDGTFKTSENLTGKWYQLENQIIWEYTNGTTYEGTKVGAAMLGMMTTTQNSQGCWYCVKKLLMLFKKARDIKVDSGGKKIMIQKK